MTVSEAIDYVRAKIASIRALPNALVKQRQQLTYLRDTARAAGNVSAQKDAQLRLDEALNDLSSAQTLNTRLDSVIDAYDSVKQAVGLGVVPVLPIAAGVVLVTVAVTAGYLLKAYDTRSLAIEALARGTLTPAQFQQFQQADSTSGLSGFFGDVKNLVLLGIGVAVALAIVNRVPARRVTA